MAIERNRSSSRRARVRLRAWALAALLFAPAAHADGTLLIVGGALAEDNAAVHRALIESLPPEGLLVIIPAASGRPARAADDFTQSLVRHGLARERIARFPLAVRDDSATPDIDESTWRDNAWATGHVERVRNAAGFWFTGGDQMRITQTLRNAEGEESPLLALIRARLAAGAVIGGSSAGAAIMSRDMIAGGISFRALLEPLASAYSDTEDQDSGRLYLARGLGFLTSGLVDQHFDRKARLGRLVRAMAATGQAHGFGIDEDTALEVRLGENSARVLGRGSVTLLDATHARYGFGSPALVADLEISVIAPGDRFRLSDLELLNTAGDATVGKEYFGYQPLQGGGMALANPRLDQGLGHDLLDNDASRVLKRYSIDEAGRVLVYRFTQTDRSAGYWRNEGARDHYTVTRVRFDILSLRATLPPH